MTRLYKKISEVYLAIGGSIALWPSVIALGFLALGFFTSYFERTQVGILLEKSIPFEFNTEPDNARTVLTTIASGTITLMVFSFSMVMIVLSQATSNLTPRVVPGLISDKMNQVVLGVNIGTILYTLILLLSFKPGEENASVPLLGILVAMIFAICCVALFVYFIHSISRAIKPDTILTRIYGSTLASLEKETKSTHENEVLKSFKDPVWYEVKSKEGGYLRLIELESLNRLAEREDLVLEILVPVGKFIVPGFPFLLASKDLQGQDKLLQEIQDCFIFSLEEVAIHNFEYGLRQLSEVGVKAMSPGINDPGTALAALDFLTLVLIKRMQCIPPDCFLDQHHQVRIIKRPTSLHDLLYHFLTPIRTYGKTDTMVMRKLLVCLQYMVKADQEKGAYLSTLLHHIKIIREDAYHSIKNQEDRSEINQVLKNINHLVPDSSQHLALLD